MGYFTSSYIREKIEKTNLFKHVKVKRESDAINVLAEILVCRKEVSYRTPTGELVIDLLCGDIPIEVEYKKRPFEGFQQAIAYIVLAGFKKSMVIHIFPFYDKYFVKAFCNIVFFLRNIGIDGLIIVSDTGEVVEC